MTRANVQGRDWKGEWRTWTSTLPANGLVDVTLSCKLQGQLKEDYSASDSQQDMRLLCPEADSCQENGSWVLRKKHCVVQRLLVYRNINHGWWRLWSIKVTDKGIILWLHAQTRLVWNQGWDRHEIQVPLQFSHRNMGLLSPPLSHLNPWKGAWVMLA